MIRVRKTLFSRVLRISTIFIRTGHGVVLLCGLDTNLFKVSTIIIFSLPPDFSCSFLALKIIIVLEKP